MNAFRLISSRFITELGALAEHYSHRTTGAEVLSLQCKDDNKVFGVAFRTPPRDSTGAPHVLEHCVLQGSRKYPLKQPFAELRKRSLYTFFNAFTDPDKTFYCAASRNTKDLFHLVDLCLDAVFHPLLSQEAFMQEGWRRELEDLRDPPRLTGVVLNEMKGMYASPAALLHKHVRRSLFPDTPYFFDAGGDPSSIPKLTLERLREFHETHYHPSNARFFLYGNEGVQGSMELIGDCIKDFTFSQWNTSVPLQTPFEKPRKVFCTYPKKTDSDDEPSALITVNWAFDEMKDPADALGLELLAQWLVGRFLSPLRKVLAESRFGRDVIASGLESGLRQRYFSVGLEGTDTSHLGDIEGLILNTLDEISRGKLDRKGLQAALNTFEFRLREKSTGSSPRGLIYMLRALSRWLYGGNPLDALAYQAPLEALKASLKSGPAVPEKWIEEYFLDNPHRTSLVLGAEGLGRTGEGAWEAEGAGRSSHDLSETERRVLVNETIEFRKWQESAAVSGGSGNVPALELDDIDPQEPRVPTELLFHGANRMFFHDLFTEGIAYVDLALDLGCLESDLLPFVRLFGHALLDMDKADEDSERFSQRVASKTGGIKTLFFCSKVLNEERTAAFQFIRAKATAENFPRLLDIISDLLLKSVFDDRDGFRRLVHEEMVRFEQQVSISSHAFLNMRLRAHFTQADYLSEIMGGMSYLFFLRRLRDRVDNDWPSVLEILNTLRDRLANRCGIVVNLTLEQDRWGAIVPRFREFLERFPSFTSRPATWERQPMPECEAFTLPSPLSFVCKGVNLYQRGIPFDGSMHVAGTYLKNTWLWDEVRLKGGAYGAFSYFDRFCGTFSLASYRDPNILKTLEIFDGAGDFLLRCRLTEREMTDAIIALTAEMDAPRSPDTKGYLWLLQHLAGEDETVRQQIRQRVLSTRPSDFRQLGAILKAHYADGLVKILGSEEAVERAAAGGGSDWLQIMKVV